MRPSARPHFTTLLFLLAAISFPLGVTAQVRREALPPHDSLLVQGTLEFLADSGGQWTLNDVRQRAGLFQPAESQYQRLGYGRPVQWLRVRVMNKSGQPMPLMAVLDRFLLDKAHFYLFSDLGQLLAHSGPLDWTVLPHERSIIHRNPLFPFTLAPRQAHWVYAQIGGTSPAIVVRLQVQTARLFYTHDRQERMFWNWALGVFCWLMVISIILGILLKESMYGYYSLYILVATVYVMAMKGFVFEWFPARQYGFVSARHLPAQLTYVSLLALFLFIRQYVLTTIWHHAWVRRISYFIPLVLGFSIAFICFELPFADIARKQADWIMPMLTGCYVIPALMLYGLICWQAIGERHRRAFWDMPARYYLISFSPFVFHMVGSVLHNYSILANYTVPRMEGVAVAYLLEFILLSVGISYRYKRMTNEHRMLAQQTLEQQLKLQQEQNRVLEAQLHLQREKQRIARDLHDNVGSQLSVIAANSDYTDFQVGNGTPGSLSVGQYARDAMQSLRDTIWAIHQEQVSIVEFRIKLREYLLRQAALVSNCQFELQANAPDTLILSSVQALNLFRIVQEALQNTLKYGQATHLLVEMRLNGEQDLEVSISDDGRGFDAGTIGHNGLNLGMLNMQHRAQELGGHCRIESAVGMGTQVLVSLPLIA